MENTKPYKIGLAGCGKMGSAMVRAWLAAGVISQIHVLDPGGLPPELALESRVVYTANENIFLSHAANWDLLVIAIKPQSMDDFAEKVADHLPHNLGLLSIAAGQTIGSFKIRFGGSQPIVRSMPNTPASIGKGMTVACASDGAPEAFIQCSDDLLKTLGKTRWVNDESLLDAVTAVSGSGPAYVFYLIEALAKAGEKSGLEKDFAMTLARQTVIGAASLAEQDEDIPANILRENVTSPNGTTAAALEILMNGKLQILMDEAVAKATARSKELSR